MSPLESSRGWTGNERNTLTISDSVDDNQKEAIKGLSALTGRVVMVNEFVTEFQRLDGE